MPLITADDVKTYLGLSGSGEDDYLAQLVGGVNGSIARYLRRNLEATTGVVEYHSGHCRERLYLKNRPATSITGVYVDRHGYYGKAPGSPFGADTQLTEGVDFVAESNEEGEANQSCLMKLCGSPSLGGGTWESGIGNIKVIYDYGYAVIPEQVKLAALMIATGIRKQRKSGVVYSSETLGSYSYSVLAGHGNPGSSMSEFFDAIGFLKPYKEISI